MRNRRNSFRNVFSHCAVNCRDLFVVAWVSHIGDLSDQVFITFLKLCINGIAKFMAELPCWHFVSTEPWQIHHRIIFDVPRRTYGRNKAQSCAWMGFHLTEYIFIFNAVNNRPTNNTSVTCLHSNTLYLHNIFCFVIMDTNIEGTSEFLTYNNVTDWDLMFSLRQA